MPGGIFYAKKWNGYSIGYSIGYSKLDKKMREFDHIIHKKRLSSPL